MSNAELSRGSRFGKTLEIVTNCVVIAVALLTGFILLDVHHHVVQQAVNPQPVARTIRPASSALVGQQLSLKEVSWKASPQTMLVAISTKCHFCIASTDFYSRLTKTNHRTPIVFVLPQDPIESTAFLSEHHISPDKSLSKPLNDVDVEGTPTILLVDSKGKITRSWVGELSPEGQKEVFTALQAPPVVASLENVFPLR